MLTHMLFQAMWNCLASGERQFPGRDEASTLTAWKLTGLTAEAPARL